MQPKFMHTIRGSFTTVYGKRSFLSKESDTLRSCRDLTVDLPSDNTRQACYSTPVEARHTSRRPPEVQFALDRLGKSQRTHTTTCRQVASHGRRTFGVFGENNVRFVYGANRRSASAQNELHNAI